MATDPFKSMGNLGARDPFAQRNRNKTPSTRRSDGFVEAISDIGSSTIRSLSQDVVKGTAQTIFDQILGSAESGKAPDMGSQPDLLNKWIQERENNAADTARSQERAFQNQKHSQEKVIFSLTDQKLSQEIQGVRQELAMLVKSMAQVEKQVENAVMDNIVDAGVYHLNYFRKLRTWIALMRKNLEEAGTWMAMSKNRKNQGYFWTQVNQQGGKYSQSSERNVQVGAG